jgi:hypothetical protein
VSFISVEIDQTALYKFSQRFTRRRQRKVLDTIKREDVTAAIYLLDNIQTNIAKQGLIETGAYRDSWHISIDPARQTILVESDHPAAHRLEYGFSGRDAMGRVYNQPPRPHVRPAVTLTGVRYFGRIRKAVIKELE